MPSGHRPLGSPPLSPLVPTAQVGAARLFGLSYPDTEHKPGSSPYPIQPYPHNILSSKYDCPSTAYVLIPEIVEVCVLPTSPSQYQHNPISRSSAVSTLSRVRGQSVRSTPLLRTFSAPKTHTHKFQLLVLPGHVTPDTDTWASKQYDNGSAISYVITS